MEDLFEIRPSNSHQSLLLKDFGKEWPRLSERVNHQPLSLGWTPLEFELRAVDEKCRKAPSIATAYIGVIAFRADAKCELLPALDGLELLPINVDHQPWLMLNCLNSARDFEEQESQVLRGLNGQIFMILKLKVTDIQAGKFELFTLANSNRAQLFARPSFKERVESLGLEGVNFHRIGTVV